MLWSLFISSRIVEGPLGNIPTKNVNARENGLMKSLYFPGNSTFYKFRISLFILKNLSTHGDLDGSTSPRFNILGKG
ncbi:hypothetical protein DET59_103257 [Rossellomorea aquimaris]|uniref:Uncharacterized protein n=1 Tax=Rossellomorea aquimaris TaxID=189382 RepID=A0A366EW27_9BACI|nr:hypothetical protein DET59_103257 [Rossellomorea aquimaris]